MLHLDMLHLWSNLIMEQVMNHTNRERVVYPIHNVDLERIGLESTDEEDGGTGIMLTPGEIEVGIKRWEKMRHDNPLAHRDLSRGVQLMIEVNREWEATYNDLDAKLLQAQADRNKHFGNMKESTKEKAEMQVLLDDRSTQVDRCLKEIQSLKETLGVKETALDARDERLHQHAKKAERYIELIGLYEKRYGVFSGVDHRKYEPLRWWQRWIGRLFGILLP